MGIWNQSVSRSLPIVNFRISTRLIILLFPLLIIALLFSSYLFYPEKVLDSIKFIFSNMTNYFGFFFLLYGLVCLFGVSWVACSSLGDIRLGEKNQKPQFSYFEWISLLFCSGIGVSVILWGLVESLYYIKSPPYNIKENSALSLEWAHMIPLFHWGISAWAIYCLPTISMAYFFYVKKSKQLSFSSIFQCYFSKKKIGAWSTAVDLTVVLATLGGVGTSLGLIIPVISHLIEDFLSIEPSLFLDIVVLFFLSVVFSFSTCLGVSSGLKRLSLINAYLAIFFIFYVLLAGPTLFILNLSTNSLGLMINNFFRMSLYLDPISQSGWPQNWTIFYWAWWVAYTPMMAIFVSKISRGRTLREIVFGMCFGGALGCAFILAVLGGYSIYLQNTGGVDLSDFVLNNGLDKTCIYILKQLPNPFLVGICFLLLAFIFSATSFDSSAYTLASLTSKDLDECKDPSLSLRFYWCAILALFALVLLVIKAFDALKLSSLLVAVPMVPLSLYSFYIFLIDARKS